MKPQHIDRPIVRARSPRANAFAVRAALIVGLVMAPLVANSAASVRAALPTIPVSCAGATYTVKPGDYWVRIAAVTGVPTVALLGANKATKSTVIHPRQVICLPAGASTTATAAAGAAGSCAGPGYTVLSGDGWIRIAARTGVSLTALLSANKATKATVIRTGQVLCLPAGAVTVPTSTSTAATTTTTPKATATGSCAGPGYTVLSGDGWIRIAARTSVSLTALLSANKATKATVIRTGQVLCLPTGATTTTTPTTTTVPSGPVTITQFPVQGLCWFSDSWGAPRAGGRKHEGVDIIAAQGQNVYAVDDGVLTKQFIDGPGLLAGNGWRLTRSDGTYFFYGHLSAFAPGLTVGSAVVAGQIIGFVGRTGAAGTAHLHFEVHPGGGAPINPTPIVKAINGCKITAVPPQPSETTTTTTTTVASTP